MSYDFTNRAMMRLILACTIIAIGISSSLKAQPVLDTLGNFWNYSAGTSIVDIRTVSVDSSGFIYIGIWDIGLKRTTDGGSTWMDITNNLAHKDITAIEFDSTGKIYVGTYGGGVFVSSNNGNNWSPINNGIQDLRITALKVRRGGPIMAGTKSQGLFRSTDGGQNWTQVNSGLNIWEITALHFSRNGFILAGTSSWGVYRSEDNGLTWKRSNGSLTNKNVTSFAQNSLGEIACGTLGGGVNYSVDNGASWTEFQKSDKCVNATCVVWSSATSPVAGLSDKGIVRYDDRAYEDWVLTSYRISGVHSMVRSANGYLWASLPLYGLYKSSNQGANWFQVYGAAGMTAAEKVFPMKNGVVLSTTEAGGLQRSTDNGLTWTSAGMNGIAITSAALDSLGNIFMGTYTMTGSLVATLYKSVDGGATWSSMYSKKDSVISAIAINPQGLIFTALKFPPSDPKNPNSITSELYMSSNNGTSWSHIAANGGSTGIQFIGINFNGDVYVSQVHGFYRSTNNGTDWILILPIETAQITSVGFSTSRAIYAGSNLGVFRSADHGVNWSTYDFGLQYPHVTYIIVTPYNQIYAALGYSNGVVVSTNSGQSWDYVNRATNLSAVQSFAQSKDGFIFFTTSGIYRGIEPNSLPAPALQTPVNNAEGVDLMGTFTWNPAPKADMYEFQISNDVDFYSLKDYITTGATSYTLKYKLESSALHYWRVRSRSNNALGAWSPTRVLTTILDKPELIDPPNNSGSITNLGPILKWHKLKGASVYTVQVSTDPAFSTTIFSKDLPDTLVKTINLQLYTKYYWRVAGKSSKAQGPWSDVWMFTTKLKPVTLKSPANSSTGMPNQVLMQWNLSDGANKYEIQYAKDSLFNQMVYDGLTDQNNQHLSKILENFTTYWWRIRALDDNGSSDWCGAWYFTTVIAAPELVAPNDASKDVKVKSTFEWKDYNAATTYHIQISLNSSFNQLVLNDSTLTSNTLDVTTLDYFTKYYWRVRLYSNKIPGLWSATWSITTGIGQVKLVSPDNDAIDLPVDMTFIWDAVKGADTYIFQLSKLSDFSTLIKETEVTDTKSDVPALSGLTKYYYRVKAKYADGEGEWSETRNFTTITIPDGVLEAIPGMSDLFLYPNPFSESLNLSFSLEHDAYVSIEIVDMKGISVFRSNYGIMTAGNQMLSIAPAGLSRGTYTLNLMINGKSITRMINLVK